MFYVYIVQFLFLNKKMFNRFDVKVHDYFIFLAINIMSSCSNALIVFVIIFEWREFFLGKTFMDRFCG